MLRWARTSANLEPLAAARKIGVTDSEVTAWESGAAAPTIAELRRAATVYDRPLAAFYLPEPPRDFETLRDYRRTVPGTSAGWSGPLMSEYRRAHAQREVLLDIAELDGSAIVRAWRVPGLPNDVEGVAVLARNTLMSRSPRAAPGATATEFEHLNFWTACLEAAGVMIMTTERGGVSVEEMRGFSLYFDINPVIALNGADWARSRLFSLLHEYAHLLLHTAGICDTTTDRNATTEPRRLEARCNAIAAATLIPATEVLTGEAVRQHTTDRLWTLGELIEAARPFGVSVEAFLRRLLTLGEVTHEEYRNYRSDAADNPPRPKGATGGNFYVTKSRDLGRGYVRTVADAHHRALIDTYSAATFLDVKVSQIPRLARAARL